MQETTKDNFFKVIGPQDVIVTVTGNYPYTDIFKTRDGREVGRIVGGKVNKYFLSA